VPAAASCSLISAPGTGHINAEFVPTEGKIIWTMKSLGGSEQTMRQDHFESTMHDADPTGDWAYQYVL
jgi:hypothetical protein